jgi:predicted neutral ceramidase superfamily lipid hydrolase
MTVKTLPPSTIVMFDGHVFVCWSIDFVSFYNCDVWRSCMCMLEYRLCLLLQLWCLTVMYLYVRVSSLSPSTIVLFDGHVFVCWSIVVVSFYNCDVWRSCICMLAPTYKYMTVKHQNCRRRQRRNSNIQIHDRQTSQL